MTHLRPTLAACVLLFTLGTASFGQGGQYTAPGALGLVRENSAEQLRAAVEGARWRIGPLRVDPWFSVRDIAYVKQKGRESDITAGVGAGLRGYVPFGSKLILAAHFLPQYRWRKQGSDEKRIDGRYGLGLFYDANRLSAELTATSSEQFTFASSEVNRQAEVDAVSYQARIDLPISRRFWLFASAGRSDTSINDPDPGTQNLDFLSQSTDSLEGGVSFLAARTLRVSLGAGTTETRFDERARDRSNEGSFLSGAIGWDRPKVGATISARKNDLRAARGSSFPAFDSTTWAAQLRWSPTPRFAPILYGQRSLSYSTETDEETYLDERVGLRISFPLGRRLSPSLFYETGQNSYAGGDRVDDVTSWGGSLGLPPFKRIVVTLAGRTTRITSDLGVTTNFTELGGGVTFSFGSNRSAWY